MELIACIGVGGEVFLVNIVVCLAYIRVAGWGGGWGLQLLLRTCSRCQQGGRVVCQSGEGFLLCG